jgi:hypothetical protein
MASTDLIKQYLPSAIGNGASYGLGYMHGKNGDMPKIKDKVPYDVALGIAGYGLALVAKKWGGPVATDISMRLGDAGLYYFSAQLGGTTGQTARDKAGELSPEAKAYKTGHPDSKAILAGADAPRIKEMLERMAAIQNAEVAASK